MKDVLLLSGIIFIVTGIGFIVWSSFIPRYLVKESYEIVSEECDPASYELETFDKANTALMVKVHKIDALIDKRFDLLIQPITDSRDREWHKVTVQLNELSRQRDSIFTEMKASHERYKTAIKSK